MQLEMIQKIVPVYERRVLILDDNDGNRTILKFVMQLNNIEHVEADCGNAALRLWRPGAFSFAFLDIELPDINGLEVARQMRTLDSGIAIIMCSTNDDPPTLTAAIAAGADLFLVKPFQLDTLMNFVKVMDRGHLRAEQEVLIIDNSARTRREHRPLRPDHVR